STDIAYCRALRSTLYTLLEQLFVGLVSSCRSSTEPTSTWYCCTAVCICIRASKNTLNQLACISTHVRTHKYNVPSSLAAKMEFPHRSYAMCLLSAAARRHGHVCA
ncbi:unnamed protein product, partial [Ectocarpus sp. 8 AP-2014]